MRFHSALQLVFLAFLSLVLTACGGGGGDSDPASTFSVSGSVTGLSGSVTLQNNGTESLTLSDNSDFTVASSVPDGTAYNVEILNQPTDQICTVSNGEGVVSGLNVSNINVSCGTTGTDLEFTSFTINDGAGPKQIEFSWTMSTGTSPSGKTLDHYQILENPDGLSGFTPLSGAEAIAITKTTHELTIAVHLTDWVNAMYIIEARASDGTVLASAQVGLVSELTSTASIGYFKASNTGRSNEFGTSITLSADGNRLAVGAPFEAGNSTGVNGDESNDILAGVSVSGAVYVFSRSGKTWAQEAYVKASNAESGDFFGSSIALSPDGNTLAVGARLENSNATGINSNQANNDAVNAGAVYVFSRIDGTWTQQAYVKASNTDKIQLFGSSIALSFDGNRLAVGAPAESGGATGINGDQTSGSPASGAVYVFSRSDSTWAQEAYLKASNTDPLDQFGHSVAISSDGDTLAVGAIGESSAATGINGDEANNDAENAGFENKPGAVYVFSRGADTWAQQAYVKASNTEVGDQFGSIVGLSADGDTLAVSAPSEDSSATGIDGDEANNDAENSGSVYVFSRNSEDIWAQAAYVKASNTDRLDQFGHSVAISSDGDTLAIGAIGESSAATGINGEETNTFSQRSGSGAVYVISRSEGSWTQAAYVKASNPDPGDQFGFSAALSSDGAVLAIGAPNEGSAARGIGGDQGNDNGFGGTVDATDAGAVYLY